MKKIATAKYALALYQVLQSAEKKDYDRIFKNFIKLMAQHKIFSQADKILRKLEQYIDDDAGVKKVDVISAQPLVDELKVLLKKHLAKELDKKIELANQIDEAMIGGVVIRYDDILIDGSVARQLALLSENLNK